MDALPIDNVLDTNGRPILGVAARAAIAEADVVIGVDMRTQREFTVYGTPAFEETVRIGEEFSSRIVRIGFQGTRGHLSALVAMVQAIKRGQDRLAAID